MLRIVYYLLWITPALVFAFMAFRMHRQGLRLRYPFFFSYAVFQVLSFSAQFTVYHLWPRSDLYFYEYWVGAALSIGISFAVIYEVFVEVFRPFEGLRDLGRVLFRWAVFVLVLAAALMTLTGNTPGVFVTKVVVAMERSVRVMQCGMVLLMILCSPYLGLRRRNHIFGIATGFGVLAAIDLIAVAAVSRLGYSAATFFTLARMTAFNFAAVLWTVYLLSPEPARGPALQLAPSERWNFALSAAMHPQSSSPSLPLIMGVVDRAFERINERRGSGPSHADQ